MAFINWNLVNSAVPTYYTYVIQPSYVPVGMVNQQLPTIQQVPIAANCVTNSLNIPSQEVPLFPGNVTHLNIASQQMSNFIELSSDNIESTNIASQQIYDSNVGNFSTVVKEEETEWNFHVKEDIDEEEEETESEDWGRVSVKIEEEEEEDAENEDFHQVMIKEEREDEEIENISSIEEDEEEVKTTEEKSSSEEEVVKLKKQKKKSLNRGKILTCSDCNYTTTWKGNLTKHVISRHKKAEEIEWLQCDHCIYKGKTKDYLKCHLLHVHNISVKWFNCAHCPFKAKLKSHLNRHVLQNHTESEKINWHECSHCAYKAKFKINLKEHILSKHTESNDIQWFHCAHCKFKAKRKRNLKFHLLNKHTPDEKIIWFQCEFCPYRMFKRKQALKAHIVALHSDEAKKKKIKQETREIPVFIGNKLCWKKVLVDEDKAEDSFKCHQCNFDTTDKVIFKQHVLKEHVVTEYMAENNKIVEKRYKTRDVVVIVDDVACVRKVVELPLS